MINHSDRHIDQSIIRLLTPFLLFISGCTAHYTVNDPITAIDETQGYRLVKSQEGTSRSDTLLVVVAFSGGGTRAAAFSYGVMEALREVTINWEGHERRLLDEVDSISSVSGGSFPAAYYGLFGDRIFEDFEEKFLDRNVQGHLTSSMFKPWTWFKTGSPFFGRSDYAADYYDEILFEGKTFGDMLKRNGPIIQINATEVSTGTQFTFVQSIFDLICSDLSTFPVSRAVAASSAVPVIFSSITIDNHAGSCGYQVPPQIMEVLGSKELTSRRRHLAEKYIKYLDSTTHPYLHLFDGGLTDNLGIRPGINRLTLAEDAWELAKEREAEDIKRLLYIVVNAQSESKKKFSQSPSPVPLLDSILGATAIPLHEYTFESLVTLKVVLDKFKGDLIQSRCQDMAKHGEDISDCADYEQHLVYVDLEQLPDKDRRDRLMQLPTSFVLAPEEVDDLRDAARTVLTNSKNFQKFLNEMK